VRPTTKTRFFVPGAMAAHGNQCTPRRSEYQRLGDQQLPTLARFYSADTCSHSLTALYDIALMAVSVLLNPPVYCVYRTTKALSNKPNQCKHNLGPRSGDNSTGQTRQNLISKHSNQKQDGIRPCQSKRSFPIPLCECHRSVTPSPIPEVRILNTADEQLLLCLPSIRCQRIARTLYLSDSYMHRYWFESLLGLSQI